MGGGDSLLKVQLLYCSTWVKYTGQFNSCEPVSVIPHMDQKYSFCSSRLGYSIYASWIIGIVHCDCTLYSSYTHGIMLYCSLRYTADPQCEPAVPRLGVLLLAGTEDILLMLHHVGQR